MSDNIPLGGGVSVATDELPGGEHAQLIKLYDAAPDSTVRARVLAAIPASNDAGLVVRNIPSGTQAVSAASLPLPAGAATETTLAAVNTRLAGTLAVSAASLPLPSGAAQEHTAA